MLKAPFSSTNLAACSAVIVLDLSKPGNVLESLEYWLQTLGGIISREMNELKLEDPETFELLN